MTDDPISPSSPATPSPEAADPARRSASLMRTVLLLVCAPAAGLTLILCAVFAWRSAEWATARLQQRGTLVVEMLASEAAPAMKDPAALQALAQRALKQMGQDAAYLVVAGSQGEPLAEAQEGSLAQAAAADLWDGRGGAAAGRRTG